MNTNEEARFERWFAREYDNSWHGMTAKQFKAALLRAGPEETKEIRRRFDADARRHIDSQRAWMARARLEAADIATARANATL